MKLCLWNNWNGPLTVTLKLGTHMSNQALILRQLMMSTELEVVDLSHGCMLLLCRRKAKNADWPQLGICHMITGCQIQDLKFVVILVTKLIDAWWINALREKCIIFQSYLTYDISFLLQFFCQYVHCLQIQIQMIH